MIGINLIILVSIPVKQTVDSSACINFKGKLFGGNKKGKIKRLRGAG